MTNLASPILFITILYMLIGIVQCGPETSDSSEELISDGLVFKNVHELSSSDQCVHAYGFLPCAESVWGHIYQIVVIQYLMSRGERILTRASTKIFTALDTGIYGAIIFRILMALPILVIMTVSGIVSTKEDAQNQVSFGISVSAGSTIFMLTFLWGINVFLGSTKHASSSLYSQLLPDNEQYPQSSVPKGTNKLTNLFSGFSVSGVEIDRYTSDAAHFMFLSSIPFALMQLTVLFSNNSKIRLAVILFSFVYSFVLLVWYFRYQIKNVPAQKQSLEYATFEIDNSVKEALKDFDQDNDGRISESEFYAGLKRLMAGRDIESSESGRHMIQRKIYGPNKAKFSKKALTSNVVQVLTGFTILFALARPLTMSTQQLSVEMGIPPLIISFVMIPAVINSRRAIAALFPPNKERNDVASITFTELYNGVVMNNMMGLLASLMIVFGKNLRWNYSAEVLIIFVVCAIMGLFSWCRTSRIYPKWTCFVALVLYPCSAGLFYLFQH